MRGRRKRALSSKLILASSASSAPVGRGHQRVDLHHGGVEIAEGPVAAEDGLHRLRRMAGVEAEAEGDLAGMEGLHADGGIDADADQGLRPGGADLLDLHAARRRGHHHDPLALPVEDQAEIELAHHIARRLDIEAVHQLAARPRLGGGQALAEQRLGRRFHLRLVAAEPDAAGLAAAAGMDLGLHHPALAADLPGAIGRLLRAIGKSAAGDLHAEAGEDLFRLIFVDIHGCPRSCRQAPTARRGNTWVSCFGTA